MDVLASLLSPIFELLQGWQDVAFILWIFWALFVFWGLKNDGKDRSRFLSGMQDGLSSTYHKKLENFLDWTAKKWFKDHEQLVHYRLTETSNSNWRNKFFGIDAFTAPSYDFNLRLALVYPFIAVFVIWAINGNTGEIGSLVIFEDEALRAKRFLPTAFLLAAVWALYKFYVTSGFKRLIYLALSLSFAIALSLSLSRALSLLALSLSLSLSLSLVLSLALALSRLLSLSLSLSLWLALSLSLSL